MEPDLALYTYSKSVNRYYRFYLNDDFVSDMYVISHVAETETDRMDSFAEVVENTRALSLSQEREVRSVPASPLPSRCSSKLKMIIERQISLGQTQSEEARSGRSSLNASPYVSPYGSPCSSPRIKRKPLKVRHTPSHSE